MLPIAIPILIYGWHAYRFSNWRLVGKSPDQVIQMLGVPENYPQVCLAPGVYVDQDFYFGFTSWIGAQYRVDFHDKHVTRVFFRGSK
jgi:hypothetical protein